MNIVFIEDDPIQRKPVCTWIEEAGHQCHCFGDSNAYINSKPQATTYDLLLLDWELPGRSGLELLHWLREEAGQTLPVMFLTKRDTEEDIVAALRDGADDYLVKPARRNELLARIEAVSRRNTQHRGTETLQVIGPFELDIPGRQLRRNGEPLNLTQKEFSLAHYLLSNLGRLISREELLEQVWRQSASINTRTVDTHISRLRKKLALLPEHGWQLTAVYQYGYRLDWVETETPQKRVVSQ